MRLLFGTISSLFILASCAHRPNVPQPPDPVIHRIALIPASNPLSYTFENGMPPTPLLATPAFIGYKVSNHKKANHFNEVMAGSPNVLGDDMTRIVVRTLEQHGFVVEVLTNVSRPANSPDSVDEDQVDASVDADAIVHLWISEVGVYAGHLSVTYLPRVNAGGKLWIRRREDSLWRSDIYYGADAKKDKEWAIEPDAKYRWETFDKVMSDLDDVRGAFSEGTNLVAVRLGEQVAAAALASGHRVPQVVSEPVGAGGPETRLAIDAH